MHSILNEPEPDTGLEQIAPLLDGAMEQLGQKDHDALVLRFFEGRNFKEVGMALGASEDAAENAGEPRTGKAAELFQETRRDFYHGHHCRRGVRQFSSSRARDAGKIRDRHGAGQRLGGRQFNLNPHQRSIENYGMDKSKNRSGCWSRFNSGNRNNDGDYKSFQSSFAGVSADKPCQ